MQLDWSTVVLEIINFLVLVWILKRFLYRPVLEIIARRKAAIEATESRLATASAETDALKKQYEDRIGNWERERDAAREALRGELDAERRRRLDALKEELASEREKTRVTDERRLADARRRAEQQALQLSARFAAKLLGGLSGPELDSRLVALMLETFAGLGEEQAASLRRGGASVREAEVLSARALEPATREHIGSALDALFETPLACVFREDPALIAGVRLTVGPWVLRANIQDELQGFAELSHEQISA